MFFPANWLKSFFKKFGLEKDGTVHVVFSRVQQEISRVYKVEGGNHENFSEVNADVFAGFLPYAVYLQLIIFDLDMEYAACRLPVHGLISDWAMHEERTVFFNDEEAFAKFQRRPSAATVMHLAITSYYNGSLLLKRAIKRFLGFSKTRVSENDEFVKFLQDFSANSLTWVLYIKFVKCLA